MKKCTTCKETKQNEEFSINTFKKNGLNDNCKVCHSLYRKKHYEDNKQKYIDKARVKALEYASIFNDYMKDKSCLDCGNDNPVVLEFDHRGDKSYNISDKKSKLTLETLKLEIAKCDIVCANCHKIRTSKQFNWSKAGIA